ncbi:hypothetical protein ASG61_29175 [Bacillus sp. Leaf75]|nr:hypothetical protein ASG61_29175 [Bacillus sp. Leaf75]
MGSDRFSSDNKKKTVNILKQLLANNLNTKKTSNPLETLLSDLDLRSLEDLLQKNKKSHDDFDHKKKCHHDDFDHKKKHDHDDCHDKKKHDHDDCHDKKKHDHDDCHDKKKCCHDDRGDIKMFHEDDCGCHKNPCKKCFKHDCDCEECKCPCDAAAAVCALIGKIFWVLKDAELVPEPEPLPVPELPDPPEVDKMVLIRLLKKLSKRLEKDCKIKASLLDDLDELTWWLTAAEEVPPMLNWKIKKFLKDLLKCLGLKKADCIHDFFSFPTPPAPPEPEPPGSSTLAEKLLGALGLQVTITTPTDSFTGTLVTVQTDYVAIVDGGTTLIAIDTIVTFDII